MITLIISRNVKFQGTHFIGLRDSMARYYTLD